MQIFAYTQCPKFHALLELEVKEITGLRPVVRTSIEELQSLLGIFKNIDLLIVDFPENFQMAEELKNFLRTSSSTIKMAVVLGGEDIVSAHIKTFPRTNIQELFGQVRKNFKTPEDIIFTWTGVPLITLMHFESLPFDLYIRLSEDKYVKRIPAFEKVDNKTIESFAAKKITTLYCNKQHNRDFSMMLINNMINKVDKKYQSVKEELKATGEVFETTREIIQSLGLTGRIVEVCEASIDRMCEDVLKDANDFSEYLLNLKNDKSLGFQYRLITLTNYIGTQLILDMALPNGDEQIRKFIFASYFCDIQLKNPGFLYYRSNEDGEFLSLDEQNEVNFHALKASHLVSTYKDSPKDVSLIIQQHHGSFSGIDFPKEKSSQLLPLAKILIVAQDLAFSLLTNEEAPAKEIFKKFLKQNRCNGLQELLTILERNLV